MVKLTINNIPVEVEEGSTILEAAAKAGVQIPTLCYLKEINEIGACRVCVVEIEGESRLSAACNTAVKEGMSVKTNTKRVLNARRSNVQMILSQHNAKCPTCVRSGNCKLQQLANEFNLPETPYAEKIDAFDWDKSFPLVRDDSKCIKCMRCVSVCEKIQGMNVWEANGSGSHLRIDVKDGKSIKDSSCTLCGQCITHCPVGALKVRDDTRKVIDAINDPEKTVVLQIAPAVRAAWGDGLNLAPEKATVKRLVAAMHACGIKYVFDTDLTADLTIMEEGSEFVKGFGKRTKPLMTSCCPGWVRFLKKEYPDMMVRLSSAKSPQQMFGAVAKTFYAEKLGLTPDKVFSVSIMPCSAKKYECDVPEVNGSGDKDVDVVLTTREASRLIKMCQVNVNALGEDEFDRPLGLGTGAGVIFGATGGVMEAALRSAYFLITGKNPDADAFTDVRGMDGWKEATVDIEGTKVKVAVASGLGNARKLVEAIKAGEVDYDFVEVMACPGGCAGGGGQPIADGCELAEKRGAVLYNLDKNAELRFSHENPDVQMLYKEYFTEPLSEKAHHLLHTDQTKWTIE